MILSRRFVIFAATCSFVSVVSTLALIFLPDLYGPIESLNDRVQLVESPAYLIRAWVYLLHPFGVYVAALAVGVTLMRTAVGTSLVGVLGFTLWAATEAGQQALTLIAFHGWAGAYSAANAEAREVLTSQIAMYDAIWDSLFFLLLIGFLVGNVAFGIALTSRQGFDRVLGILYLAVGGLTLMGISRHLGGPGLPASLSGWLYPVIQPVTRVLIGVWLLRLPFREDRGSGLDDGGPTVAPAGG